VGRKILGTVWESHFYRTRELEGCCWEQLMYERKILTGKDDKSIIQSEVWQQRDTHMHTEGREKLG
jgi:hypothetical protein